MKFFSRGKDGGPESKVHALFIIEIKPLFSIVLLHFHDGARDAFHTHAFNAISWLLKGELTEDLYRPILKPRSLGVSTLCNALAYRYRPSVEPIITPRERFHKVSSVGDSWAITFRGPWAKTWEEHIPVTDKHIILSNGRKVVAEVQNASH